MKSYQIYVNSLVGTGSFMADTGYLFDWNILPEGEYEMTFCYISKYEPLDHAVAVTENTPVRIDIEVPFSTNKYLVNTTGSASSTQTLGFLYAYDGFQSATKVMRQVSAKYTDNPPIHIYGKPQGNGFRVKLFRHGGQFAYGQPYDLVINLKHIC